MSVKTLTINTNDSVLKRDLKKFVKDGVISVDRENICIVSNLLAEYVINNIDDIIITKIIKKKTDIVELYDFKKYFYIKIKDYMNRKLRLYDIISDGIKNLSYVNFDGFIKFRLKEYYLLLENIISEVSKDYIVDKEYESFIYLMKTLIESQISIVSNLNVIVDEAGKYQVLDDYFNDITEICINEFLEEFSFKYINKDDFLMSTILSLAPEKITFHHMERVKNAELIKTLINVFGENLCICKTCENCEKN